MITLKTLIEQRVQAATRKVMAGDEAIPVRAAVDIAVQAATVAASQARNRDVSSARFAAACEVAGRIANGRKLSLTRENASDLVTFSLLVVDELWARVSSTDPTVE